jgi:hypothetical protein
MSTLVIDARIRFFRQRDHRNHRVVVVVFDEHVDRRKLGGDRGLHTTAAGLDDEFTIGLAHHGRLDDADRLDRGDELLVHCRRHRRAAGVVRIRLERTRIDVPEFGHGVLLCGSVLSPVFFGRLCPPAAVAAAGARAKPAEPGRPRVRGWTLAAAAVTAATSSLFQNKSVYWLCYPVRRTREHARVEDRHLRVPWLGS